MRNLAIITIGLFLSGGIASAQDAVKASAVTQPKAPHGARVFIVSPKNGATVGEDVHVKFGVKGIKLAPATDTAANTGHHHLLIDATSLPPMDAPIPNDATHRHFGKAQTETTIHLSPGDHTLQLDFGNFAHMQFNPPIVSKKITIHVK